MGKMNTGRLQLIFIALMAICFFSSMALENFGIPVISFLVGGDSFIWVILKMFPIAFIACAIAIVIESIIVKEKAK